MRPPLTDPTYRGRDQMTLEEFIVDVEACHFRTNGDTGANKNALFIWNIVRNWAGMDCMEEDDLHKRYAETDPDGRTWEEIKRDDRDFKEWQKNERRRRGW